MRNLSGRQFGTIASAAVTIAGLAATGAVAATAPPKPPGHVEMHQQGLEHTHTQSDLSHLPPNHTLAESGTASTSNGTPSWRGGGGGQSAEANAQVRTDAKLTPEAYEQWGSSTGSTKIGPYGPYSEMMDRRNAWRD